MADTGAGAFGIWKFRGEDLSLPSQKFLDHAILGWTYLFRSTVRRGARLHARACPLVQRLYLTGLNRGRGDVSPAGGGFSLFESFFHCFTAALSVCGPGWIALRPAASKSQSTMFRILLFLLLGIGAGYLLRHRPVVRLSGYGTRAAVVALLFVFGASIGANRELIASLSRFGLQAVVFALLGVTGSLCAVRVARRLLTRKGGAR